MRRHDGNGQRRPEEIEAEIARTRTDMDATLTAIEQRLTPGQLVDQGLDYLRHSGGREFVSNLTGSVKNNPIPVALMGIGMAWLMATGNRKPSYLEERERGKGGAGVTEKVSERWSAAKASMSSTRERMGNLSETARQRMERVRGSYDSIVQEQPLVLGLLGMALGALLGAGMPRTRQEDELMGEASDRLTEKAREVGREQVEKAKEVAGAAKDTAMKEAGKQGMTTGMATQPAGRPSVIEPARATPATGTVRPGDPRPGTP